MFSILESNLLALILPKKKNKRKIKLNTKNNYKQFENRKIH